MISFGLVPEMSSITMAGYPLTYAQARSWLVNAGIDPSPYDNLKPNMLDRLVDLLEEKKWYPVEITINPIDHPITREPIFVLTRIVVRNLKKASLAERDDDSELKKQLLESSGFKDDEMPWRSYYQG